MPAEAFLDVSKFSRQKEIRDLLHKYGFGVTETSSGRLHVQGSFLKLKVIRSKLMQLLAQETRTSSYANGYSNGSASNYGLGDLQSVNDSTPRYRHINGRSVYAVERSPSIGTTSRSPEFYKNQLLSQTDSPAEGRYSTQDSFSTPQTKNLPSAKHTETSFHIDADVYRYAMSFQKDVIKRIESTHRTRINHEGDSDHLKVKLSGGAFEEAAKELSCFMQKITSSLCTQTIDLNELDSSQKKQISQNVEAYQYKYAVLIAQHANILRIVGTSRDSYEAKRKILRPKSDNSLLSSLRRSSSLPRHSRSRKDNVDLRQSPDTEFQATAESSYSASRYQTDSKSQASPQERGRQPIKSTAQQRRAHSADSRQKNKSIENNPVPPLDQQDLSPSSGYGTSKKSPNLLKSLLTKRSLPKLSSQKIKYM